MMLVVSASRLIHVAMSRLVPCPIPQEGLHVPYKRFIYGMHIHLLCCCLPTAEHMSMLVCDAISLSADVFAMGLNALNIARTDRAASSTLVLRWMAALGSASSAYGSLVRFKRTLARDTMCASDRALVEFARRGFVDGDAGRLFWQIQRPHQQENMLRIVDHALRAALRAMADRHERHSAPIRGPSTVTPLEDDERMDDKCAICLRHMVHEQRVVVRLITGATDRVSVSLHFEPLLKCKGCGGVMHADCRIVLAAKRGESCCTPGCLYAKTAL
jgi:hypothetical protein